MSATATSSSISHIYVFVIETNGRDEKQNVNNLHRDSFEEKKRYTDEKQKHTNLWRLFTYLSLYCIIVYI